MTQGLHSKLRAVYIAICVVAWQVAWTSPHAQTPNSGLAVTISAEDGSYTISAKGLGSPVLHAEIAAEIDGQWLSSSAYTKHNVREVQDTIHSETSHQWEVTFSGILHQPDLRYRLRLNPDQSFGEVQAWVINNTGESHKVNAIRMMQSLGSSVLNLGAPAEHNRVLSDSFSEDVPAIRIRDLRDADQNVHRGVGSQLIYNRQSHWSFLAGAESSDRFITLLRLNIAHPPAAPGIASYAIESTGTTEIMRENSLVESPQQDQLPLSLTVASGEELASERLFFSVGRDYHRQLEAYGRFIRDLHHARVGAQVPMGWWSWTSSYYGLNEGAAYTNAQWLAQNLSGLGYNYFHLDEGYQYARGEYTTADATQFPHGMVAFERTVRDLGLTGGLWTAPFEVSERSAIFTNHRDWLVRNGQGEPIHLGWANDHHDRLYALDTTNPGAQDYLRSTYATLVNSWGIRYIKLDFMDDSAVEGVRYKPNTSAMEAQRIGLAIIREVVGDSILLDKDGSAMLNPVGFVDFGRIAQDTGHTFAATQEAAPAIAARYYMNRNFFVSDPDAFTVSTQTIKDHPWNGGKVALTFEEAKVSIALSAVSGGMFEIGDDLPTLGSTPERLALVKNPPLLNMVRLGEASTPVDLMSFDPLDLQPSLFVLHEDERHTIVTLFNWTALPRTHTLPLATLGLPSAPFALREIFNNKDVAKIVSRSFTVTQPGHSVRMFEMVNTSLLPRLPDVVIQQPRSVKTGIAAAFSARTRTPFFPPFQYRWIFGDGVSVSGPVTSHTYTQPGTYHVLLEAVSLSGTRQLGAFDVTAEGSISSIFVPQSKTRFHDSSRNLKGEHLP